MKLRRIVSNSKRTWMVASLAAFAAGAKAQTVVEAQPMAQAVQNRNIEVQPVVVSPGMEPTRVPRTENAAVSLEGDGRGIVVDGAETGVQGDNPGNANTGGVQVQNVTVQANPEMDQTAATGYSAVDAFKKRRDEIEKQNESRLLEKIEEGRLQDERSRSNTVEGLDSSFSAGAAASAGAGGASAAAAASSEVTPVYAVASAGPVASVSSSVGVESTKSSSFAIVPFGGWRYLYDSTSEFVAFNKFLVGASLEGRLGSFMGVEGNFTYGKDEFEYNGFHSSYYNPQYYGAYYDTNERTSYEFGGNLLVGPNNNKFRPYGLLGFGAIYQQYDIDDQYTQAQLEYVGLKRATTNFYNTFGGGLDYKFSQNFGMGARVEYQYVYGNSDSAMGRIWGDTANRLKATGNLQLVF